MAGFRTAIALFNMWMAITLGAPANLAFLVTDFASCYIAFMLHFTIFVVTPSAANDLGTWARGKITPLELALVHACISQLAIEEGCQCQYPHRVESAHVF
jgi:hypothetical protein